MRRRELLLALATGMVGARAVRAQQKTIRVLGFLHGGPSVGTSLPNSPSIAALKRGLNETGYVDGGNFRIEYRASVEELIRDQAEVIIVAAGGSIVQARSATSVIPLVFIAPYDPVSTGLVASLINQAAISRE